jgi:hypothetical protein
MSHQSFRLLPQFDATQATAYYLAATISEKTYDKLEGLDKPT